MWFYDIEHGREIERIADSHRRECFSMKCAQDGQSFVTGGVYGDVFIWDWATRRIRSRISVAIDQRKTPIAVSAEGTLIFACQMGPFTHDQFPSVQVWSSDASRPTADLGKVFWGSHVLPCSPNG